MFLAEISYCSKGEMASLGVLYTISEKLIGANQHYHRIVAKKLNTQHNLNHSKSSLENKVNVLTLGAFTYFET
jgi:hypothetical protein